MQRERRRVGPVEDRQRGDLAAVVRVGLGQAVDLARGAVTQAVAEREQRRLLRIRTVDRRRARHARPREAQPPAEIMRGLAVLASHQHVGDALAFGTRQPRRHEGLGVVEQVVGVHRAPGEVHGHHRLATGLGRAQHGQILRIGTAVADRIGREDVAVGFGIWRLADHGHHDVELRGIQRRRIGAVGNLLCAKFGTQRPQHRIGSGEIGIAVLGALPGQRPATGLIGQVVGTLADHHHPRIAAQWQHLGLVLEQHQRLTHGLARQLTVLHGGDVTGMTAVGRLVIEQARAQLHAQDAGDRIIDARHRDLPALHLGDGIGDEGLPVIGYHHHVDAGVDRLRTAVVAAARHLGDPVPVGDDETVEAHLLLQRAGQQRFVAVHLAVVDATAAVVPAVERGHHRLHAFAKRTVVALPVHVDHGGLVDQRFALVAAAVGRAIADVVLGGGNDIAVVAEAPLRTPDIGLGEFAYHVRVGGIAFVGAPPTWIVRYCQRRREHPVDAGGTHRVCGGPADPLDQRGVAGRAQPDVVREQRGTVDVVVAVHCIGAPDHRDRRARIGGQRGRPIRIGQLQPLRDRGVLVHARPGAAAIEDRADVVLADLVGRDHLDLGLGHLAHLLRQRHLRHDLLHPRLQRSIRPDRAGHMGPVLEAFTGGRCGTGRRGQRSQQAGSENRLVGAGHWTSSSDEIRANGTGGTAAGQRSAPLSDSAVI